MQKEKLEALFKSINTAEDLLIYCLLERNWRYVNSTHSGILIKNGIFFVVKKYLDNNTFENFTYQPDMIDLMQINSIEDLNNTDIPIQVDFTPIKTDKCNWYVTYDGKLLEKGALSQAVVLMRSQITGRLPITPTDRNKVEKFQETVRLIDSYASKPKYTLAQHFYTERMVKDKAVDRYTFSEENLNSKAKVEDTDYICLKCISSAPIHLPKSKYQLIQHAAEQLKIVKLDETDTQVKLELPFKKDYYYIPVQQCTLFDLEQNLSCDIKVDSKNVIMLGFMEINPDMDELNTNTSKFNTYYISKDILEMLKILQSFIFGSAVIKKVFTETLSLVRSDIVTAFSALPNELENFELCNTQKELIYQALNENLNYTILLTAGLGKNTYEELYKLLQLGIVPYKLLGMNFSQETLIKFKEATEAGFELDIFQSLPCDEDMLSYYVDNISASIDSECEELLAQGFSQEHLRYIKRAKSRKEDFSFIDKSDNNMQLYLKDYQHRNNMESKLCEMLSNSYKCTDSYSEVRFTDLNPDCLQEIAAHLFSEVDFTIDGLPWSKIQQYVLTRSELVFCSISNGIRIKIRGNLNLAWDANSITFYNVGKPICNITFVNDKVIIAQSTRIVDYMQFN